LDQLGGLVIEFLAQPPDGLSQQLEVAVVSVSPGAPE
jgi:hypothetical protein